MSSSPSLRSRAAGCCCAIGLPGALSWRQVDLGALLSTRAPGRRRAGPQAGGGCGSAGGLGADEDEELTARYRHVQEVRTGYQHGCAELALEGEPRPQYAPGVPMMARYEAKAAELGVEVSTVRRWVPRAGPGRPGRAGGRAAGAGGAWTGPIPAGLDMARQVIAWHVPRQPAGPRPAPGRDRGAGWRSSTAPAWCRSRRGRQGMSCCGSWIAARTRSPAARRASGRSRTARRAPTGGCGRPARASTWCWTPTGWMCSRWSR